MAIDEREYRFEGCCEALAGPADYDLVFAEFATRAPLRLSYGEFQSLYTEARIIILTEREDRSIQPIEPDDAQLPKARLRHLYCKAFDGGPVPKSTAALTTFIDKVAPTLGFIHRPPSAGALRRWLAERGEIGDRRLRFMRDRHTRGPGTMRVDPVVQEVLAEKAEAFFDGVHVSQHQVYCATRARLVELNEVRRAAGIEPIRAPSRATVHRYIRRHHDYGRTTRRFGQRLGGRVFKPIKGSMKASHILEIAIMDHTPLDCGVVDDEQLIAIGRPYLTMLIDVKSRYPLGFHLGFEPPSVYSAMACLRDAVRPKCKSDDDESGRGEWIAFGVPETIVVDNAWEFTGSSFADACADAGINVTFAPVATPEYKGIGERFFGTLNSMCIHRLPGGLPLTPQQRKEVGIGVNDAVLTVSDLRRLIRQVVVEVYGREFHKGIKDVPERLWTSDARTHGQPYARDLKALDHGLSRLAAERSLSREGVQHDGLLYRDTDTLSKLLADLLPHARHRGQRWGTTRVKVKYHPEDLGQIYVWNNVRKAYATLPCTQPRYASRLSEHQHKLCKLHAERLGLAFSSEDDRCVARERLHQEVRRLLPVSKIGDRRRAQRAREIGPAPLNAEDVVLQTAPGGVPMAGAANRKAGDAPRRPPRKYATRNAPTRQQPSRSVPDPELKILPSIQDPFADVDFAQLRQGFEQPEPRAGE